MTDRPAKHSVTLRGHRTSISLEAEFWQGFRALALARGMGLNELAVEIDETRGGDQGLASAIRLAVLRFYRDAAQAGGQGLPPLCAPGARIHPEDI